MAKEEAEAKAAAEESAKRKAEEDAKAVTTRQYGEQFLVYLMIEKHRAKNTISYYRNYFKNWIYPSFGDVRIADVTANQIESLLLNMQAKGKAHSTIIGAYTLLNQMFKRAYKKDLIAQNPMDKIDRPEESKAAKEKTVSAFTAEEAQHIFSAQKASRFSGKL